MKKAMKQVDIASFFNVSNTKKDKGTSSIPLRRSPRKSEPDISVASKSKKFKEKEEERKNSNLAKLPPVIEIDTDEDSTPKVKTKDLKKKDKSPVKLVIQDPKKRSAVDLPPVIEIDTHKDSTPKVKTKDLKKKVKSPVKSVTQDSKKRSAEDLPPVIDIDTDEDSTPKVKTNELKKKDKSPVKSVTQDPKKRSADELPTKKRGSSKPERSDDDDEGVFSSHQHKHKKSNKQESSSKSNEKVVGKTAKKEDDKPSSSRPGRSRLSSESNEDSLSPVKSKASKESKKKDESPEKGKQNGHGKDNSLKKEANASKRPRDKVDSDDDEDLLPPPSKSAPKKQKKTEDTSPVKSESEASKPALTPEEKKRVQSSNYFKFISRGGPKHLGSKEVPVGSPNCLKALTFVTTGVLDSLERDDIVSIVGKYGGRVTTSVSRRTSYLLVGDEPGESKIKKAKDLNVPRMTEDEFLDLIRKSNPNQSVKSEPKFFGVMEEDEVSEIRDKTSVKSKEPKTSITTTPTKSKPGSFKRSRAEIDEDDDLPVPKAIKKDEQSKVKIKPLVAEKLVPTPAAHQVSEEKKEELMWVDKYKPSLLKNVVGQNGEKSNANKLLKWLREWYSHHGRSDEKVKAAWVGLRDPEGKTSKAALLSGPPGIGKTTTAHLSCKQIGYDYFELNASDTRNKRGLHDTLSDSLSSEAILGFKTKSKKHVLIMDEVDGMSGNEDRGGIQELIGLIKTSKTPIICICNDRNHPKIRSLANYCFDLRFNKPTNEQLKAMVQSICFKEKMKLATENVQQLINSTDHDIRQILHQLHLIKEQTTPGNSLYNPKKDLRFGPWDVCRKVFSAFEHRSMSLQDKSSLFFQDYNIGPLFVQENYLKWTPVGANGNRHKVMDLIKASAESIATGDLVENLIRRSNNWSLLPTQAVFSSVLPGEFMAGNEVSGIEFPRWLGKNSNKGKMSRLLQQLHNHVHLQVSGSLEALNMDYLPYLRRSIVNPLVKGDIDESVELMQNYSLLREDLDNIMELSLWPGSKDPMEKLDTKTKSSFTRKVNKEILPYSVIKITKGRGRKAEDDMEGLEEDDENPEEEEEEEEEDLNKDAMIKKRVSKTKSEPVAGTSKGGSSRSTSSKSSSRSKKK